MVHRIHGPRGVARLLAIIAAALLLAIGLTAATTSANASSHFKAAEAHPAASQCGATVRGPARPGGIAGVVRPASMSSNCAAAQVSEPASGAPPLTYHAGRVMGTSATGPVVLTPIYWNPSGHKIGPDYKNVLTTYMSDVAADSGSHTNIYSTLFEYYEVVNGNQRQIDYDVRLGTPINDTNPLPASGCTVAANDHSGIYADNSGYNACLDDDQLIAETEAVVTQHGLPRDYANIYVLFLPKHVESCFFPGSTTTSSNFCTINNNPSAAYCAYHNFVPSDGLVYANMPFPIYHSPVGFTCGSDAVFAANQAPNGNVNADVEISPTSHEIMEAITDPQAFTVPNVGGWYDVATFENGDECAYRFGHTGGSAGARWNQTINGNHYLTQTEFSNNDFAVTGRGCLQYE